MSTFDQGFKEANTIELHDVDVFISRQDIDSGWRDYGDGPSFFVRGSTLQEIGEALGLSVADKVYTGYDPKERASLSDIKWSVERQIARHNSGGRNSYKVLRLWAADAPQFLRIRMQAQWEDNNPVEMIDVSYSGSYTVWWRPSHDNTFPPNATPQ